MAKSRAVLGVSAEVCCRVCAGRHLRAAGAVAGYQFVECLGCGFVFTPAITAAVAETWYGAGEQGARHEAAPVQGWADPSFLEPALERLPSRPLRILDFGAGESVVPDLLRREGHEVIALDVSPPSRPHPQRLVGSLGEVRLPPESFDLVYAFQVFEHLPEPRPVLEDLLALVRPGGLFLVHTDMETPERAQGFEAWWYVSPPNHCSFFRHRTFEHLVSDRPDVLVWRDPKTVLIRRAGSCAGRS